MAAAACRGQGGLSVFILWLSSLLMAPAWAQNAKPSNANKQFNPVNVESNTAACDIPPRQTQAFEPKDEMCVNVMDDILQDEAALQQLAQAHAPYLYFHPMEHFTMSSVNRTFGEPANGTIYFAFSGLSIYDEELNQTSLMLTTRDRDLVMFSDRFFFQYDNLTDDYKFGDGFDASGESFAPVYFRPFDSGNGTITIHYFMYYAWTGPTSLGILTSHNNTNRYNRITLAPWGVHEGGWEAMSVTVCKHSTPSQPLGITYRQRNFGQMLDCTKGECTFHEDSATNPVGFVALNSHNVYPSSVTEMVIAEAWPLEWWVNLQAVLTVDRTAYADRDGAWRRYSPNPNNVKRFAEQIDIPGNVDQSDYWMAFGGRWGRSSVSVDDIRSEYPFCMENDTLSFKDCPTETEDPIFLLVMQLLGLNETSNPLVLAGNALSGFLTGFFGDSVSAPLGPATEAYFSRLNGVGNADIWDRIDSNTTGPEYCRSLIENIPNTTIFPSDVEILPLVKNVIGIVFLVALFTICSIGYFIVWKAVDRTKPILEKDELDRFVKPEMKDRRWVYAKAWLYTFAWLVTLGGAILFFIGYDQLLSLLETTFPGLDFDGITTLFYFLGILVLIIDTFLLIAVWLRSDDLWMEINETYYDIIGDDEGMAQFKRLAVLKYNHAKIHAFFVVSFAFIVLSLVLAVIMVIIGIFNVGFSYAFGQACRAVVGSIDNICIHFPVFGMEDIKCGRDFQNFCNEWAQKEMVMTLWGAFIVVIGHFFLIGAGGMAVVHNRLSKRALALLPSREEYAQGLTLSQTNAIDPQFSTVLNEKEEPSEQVEEEKEGDDVDQPEKSPEPEPKAGDDGDSPEAEEENVIEFHAEEEQKARSSGVIESLSGIFSSMSASPKS